MKQALANGAALRGLTAADARRTGAARWPAMLLQLSRPSIAYAWPGAGGGAMRTQVAPTSRLQMQEQAGHARQAGHHPQGIPQAAP